MSYPPLPSNGETNWGDNFRAWADALQGSKVEGTGMTLRRDVTVGTRILLDHSGGTSMLMGDTGWRDIEGLLQNGWTGAVRLRRAHSDVMLLILGLKGQDATDDQLLTLPPGFSDGFWREVYVHDPKEAKMVRIRMEGGKVMLARRQESYWSAAYVQIHLSTLLPAIAWPTTLPGIPG